MNGDETRPQLMSIQRHAALARVLPDVQGRSRRQRRAARPPFKDVQAGKTLKHARCRTVEDAVMHGERRRSQTEARSFK